MNDELPRLSLRQHRERFAKEGLREPTVRESIRRLANIWTGPNLTHPFKQDEGFNLISGEYFSDSRGIYFETNPSITEGREIIEPVSLDRKLSLTTKHNNGVSKTSNGLIYTTNLSVPISGERLICEEFLNTSLAICLEGDLSNLDYLKNMLVNRGSSPVPIDLVRVTGFNTSKEIAKKIVTFSYSPIEPRVLRIESHPVESNILGYMFGMKK